MNKTIFTTFLYDQWDHSRKLLYLVKPSETTFKYSKEVPNYWQQIWKPFFCLLLLEQIILIVKKKKFRMNDQFTSLSFWLFDETVRAFSRGAEYYLYTVIYEKWHIWDLAWDSPYTWFIAVFGVEFCYYWAHRCNHEVHFLWAFHQVHHSSQEFNLAIGLRQSILQNWCNFIFFSPLALFVPPTHFMTHKQLNLIYQLWIHTTLIGDLGPLEWIFNTAKHHRIHHGCNIYCLDKNYGGVLIIWDRLFGTFQEEMNDEIIYGLVTNVNSFNILYLQLFYIKDVIMKSLSMPGWVNKFAVFWKGPSWVLGGPRLGLQEKKIHVLTRPVHTVEIKKWHMIYIFVHFSMVIINQYDIFTAQDLSDSWTIYMVVNNLLILINMGIFFDGDDNLANILELIRITIYISYATISRRMFNTPIYYCVQWLSYMFWLTFFLQQVLYRMIESLFH